MQKVLFITTILLTLFALSIRANTILEKGPMYLPNSKPSPVTASV